MPSEETLTVAWISLGCPKNLVDSEVMLARLAEAGCTVGAPMDQADVIVVNTCGFVSAAIEESMAAISEAVDHKRSGRARRVVVAGCLCNRLGRKLLEQVPDVDAVVGVNNRHQIVAAVRYGGPQRRIAPCRGEICSDAVRFRLTPRHTAYLRIAEGCSQRCTFCTIPAIRGPFRSKPPDAILAEACELIADGAVELNVIAQDTTGYGSDLAEKTDLPSLLRLLDELEPLRWIRLLYAYPRRFTDRLIDTIAECPRVVPYVELPLQHVSDTVLRRMGRCVSRKDIEWLLDRLRRRVPHLVIRTTFIVGFPGETDEDFAELLRFVRDFRFDALGVFEFSAEDGTPAAELARQVPDEVKAQRAQTIMLAQQRIAFAANRRMVGKRTEVLVDGLDQAGRCIGRHCRQAPEIDGLCYLTDPRWPGAFVRGQVVDASGYDLIVRPE